MSQFGKPEDIWVLTPEEDDLIAGAEYAAITLPWTFNRMMLNTSSRGQQSRALNITKGIVAQEMLRRAFIRNGITPQIQRKSHRDDDLFDFRLPLNGSLSKLDVKTNNYYSNYSDLGRAPLSKELIAKNADYPGPDWRIFFPMLVPHTQIGQSKEAYCFGIASSIDFRNDIDTNRLSYALTAFPYGEAMAFLGARGLCLAREEAGKGIYLRVSYNSNALLGVSSIDLVILGEWDGQLQKVNVTVKRGETIDEIGPFSCVSSFQLSKDHYTEMYGQFTIGLSKNDFTQPVLNSARRNINRPFAEDILIGKDEFCNLILPGDYTMYYVGWTTKEEFLENCRKYSGWVWPKDSVNKYENQAWSQITESDRKSIDRAGFSGSIKESPRRLDAGWMKTNGRGGGSCCYVFPNIGRNGGVKETNLFVLPQDLKTMDSLVNQE